MVDQQAAQGVGVRCPDLGPVGAGAPSGAAFLDRVERCLVDDGGVGGPVGPDPLVPFVPFEFGLVAERDVVDIEEGLGFALFVPDLVARVARVRQDGLHRALGPGDSGAVSVAGSVVGRRRQKAFVGERLGDQEDTHAVEVPVEDSFDDWCGDWVFRQNVETLAVGGFRRVGMGAGVGELVAVGWSAAEVAAFDFGLGLHRGPDPNLDAVSFAF